VAAPLSALAWAALFAVRARRFYQVAATLHPRVAGPVTTLRSPTGLLRARVGRAGAATQRNLGDSKGQQGITNLEVSSPSQYLAWGAKPLE
jgi:hypothetical protein